MTIQRAVVMMMFLGLFLVSTPVFAAAGINPQIPFYGTLKDGDGEPVSGAFDMVFRLYDDPVAGTMLWEGFYTMDNGNEVIVTDGAFSVMLGSGSGNEFELDFNDDSYYLGITVGEDLEMAPRERLGAAPYAFNAAFLNGLSATDFLRATEPALLDASYGSSLLTIYQSGAGGFISASLDGGSTEQFAVDNDGRIRGARIETYQDEINIFAGPLSVQSGDESYFGGDITLGDGVGILFGDGLRMYQDSSEPGTLLLEAEDALALVTEAELSFRSGEDADLILGGDGVQITQSGLTISGGSLLISDADAELSGGGVFRAESLSGGIGFALESTADGTIVAGEPLASDERLKQNIETIEGALDMVLALRGVRYAWRDPAVYGAQTEIGFIAQEVAEVVPEVVRERDGMFLLNTKNIVAVLVEAFKELHQDVERYFTKTDRLEADVAALRARIEELEDAADIEPPEAEQTETSDASMESGAGTDTDTSDVSTNVQDTDIESEEELVDEPDAASDTEDAAEDVTSESGAEDHGA